MANLINQSDTLNQGRVKLNAAIQDADNAKREAGSAVTTSRQAETTANAAFVRADSVQEQFNQVVIEGDSSVEAAQARVDEKGAAHSTLKGRLDSGFSEVNRHLENTPKVVNAQKYSTLKDSVNELNVGRNKILHIPDGEYSLSEPLTVSSNNTEIHLSPNSKIIKTTAATNAFIVTGNNCTISGGTIESPAVYDGTNRKWQDNEAVILVKGDGFKAKGLKMINVFKIGIGIRAASDCTISEISLDGRYPASGWTGDETAHFGVAIDPSINGKGMNIIVTNNIIKGCVQGVFVGTYGAGNGYGINISNNVFEGCHNHGIYSNGGTGTVISGNSFNRCSLPIAIYGKYAVVTNNNIHTYSSGDNLDLVGISVREATHCNVSNNVIKGDAPENSAIIDLTNLTENNTESNVVSGNIVDVKGGSVNAIRVGGTARTTLNRNNQIKNNIVKANGRLYQGLIAVLNSAGTIGDNNQISGNTITVVNNCNAIHVFSQRNTSISLNNVDLQYSAAAPEVVTLISVDTVEDSLITQNIVRCREPHGTNINLRGIRETTGSKKNFYTSNSINLSSGLLTSKSEIFIQVESKSVNNMIGGVYTA